MNAFVHQLPGRIKYTNVKLTRPVNADTAKIAAWFASMNGIVQAHAGPDHRQEPRRQAGVRVEPQRRHPGALDRAVAVRRLAEGRHRDARARPPRLPRDGRSLMAVHRRPSTPRRSSTCASRSPAARASSRARADRDDQRSTSTRRTTAWRCSRAGTSSRRRSRASTPEFTGHPAAHARRRDVPRRHRRRRRRRRPARSTSCSRRCARRRSR